MKKVGILLHVYHLEVLGWEKLVWGDPAKDELGTLTKFADCLLDISAGQEVYSIIYSGPSDKDGLMEGAFARQFLVDHIDQLTDFPRLKQKINALSPVDRKVFTGRLQALVAGPRLPRTNSTHGELANAARYFAERGVRQVLQIAAASHGPRCIKLQAAARSAGAIPKDQQWFLVVSETYFNDSDPMAVAISEPPHRADDPLLGVHPSLGEIIYRYQYDLTGPFRRDALLKIGQVVADVHAAQAKSDT